VKSWLLDVKVLLGCCWKNQADHTALFTWLTKPPTRILLRLQSDTD